MLHHTGEPPDSRTRALTPAFSLLRRTLPRPGPAGARRLMTSPGMYGERRSTSASSTGYPTARSSSRAWSRVDGVPQGDGVEDRAEGAELVLRGGLLGGCACP